ncbi:Ribonuclease H [Geodia barretti]|uniref:ribonuclease H n=1 Tax=Geodia barretti TaxID=519541 RepID=A0AA35X2Q3_GEOBA|nr:Ribonuclease H [Geodia barretti]
MEVRDKRASQSQGYKHTTNNRMELMGAAETLEKIDNVEKVILITDSEYLVSAMTRGWAKRWRKNQWRNAKGDMALNPDLWGRLLDVVEGRDVVFQWVKGHAGHPQNERCDALVGEVSRLSTSEQLVDAGYERKGSALTTRSAPFEQIGRDG